MPRAIRIHETGGPEVMRLEDVEVAAPGEGEVQMRHTAIGLNYIDVYDRTGHYPQALPAGLGREGAGVVSAIGARLRGLRVGDRVAYVTSKPGTYCEPAQRARLAGRENSRGRDRRAGRGAHAQGHDRLLSTAAHVRVKRGDAIVVHAAAGGVGLLLSQWGRALGAIVIGVVGSEEKAKLAKQNGCKYVLVRGRDEIAASVKKITKGLGAHVVYDAVGKDTFFESLD